jgi:hypothetical protein
MAVPDGIERYWLGVSKFNLLNRDIFPKSFANTERCVSRRFMRGALAHHLFRPRLLSPTHSGQSARQFPHAFHHHSWIASCPILEYPDLNQISTDLAEAELISIAWILSYANFSLLT